MLSYFVQTVLDAWAKSGGGRAAAERAEEILEWMDRLYKGGNPDVKPDTITFNAVLDAWARSGDRVAPHRAEQILDHMDDLYRAGNRGVKPDTYTYNTLVSCSHLLQTELSRFDCFFSHEFSSFVVERRSMHGRNLEAAARQRVLNTSCLSCTKGTRMATATLSPTRGHTPASLMLGRSRAKWAPLDALSRS